MKNYLSKIILLWIVTAILAVSPVVWGQALNEETLKQIEKIMEKYQPANPGGQLSISQKGKIVFSKAYGMADLERNVSLTTESVIEAGSVSKQFTAAAILLLEQQGKLSTEDDIRKYLPEIPDYGVSITLGSMMRHVSGLRDWGNVAGMSGWGRSTKAFDNNDVLNIVARQKLLNYKPGERYLYSNSNYNLMAVVVQRVSGLSLAEFTKKYIFEPAGMTHTEWRNDYKKIVKNRALAYNKRGDQYQTEMPNEYAYGNGGLLTTTEDLLKWNAYYLSGKFGNPSLLEKQLQTTPFNNGMMGNYAAGLVVNPIRGWKAVSHTGATAGYRATLEHFPEMDLSIAWLSNTSEFDNSPAVSVAVRNLLVSDKAASTNNQAQIKPITLTSEQLKKYEGWYREESWARGNGIKLTAQDGKLSASRGGTLVPISEDTFMLGQNKIQFLESGKKMILNNPTETVTYVTVEAAVIDEKLLNSYTGFYYSDETESKLTFKTKDGKLFISAKPQSEFPLNPQYKDRFDSPIGEIQFIRGKENEIVGLEVSDGRAVRVRFDKVFGSGSK